MAQRQQEQSTSIPAFEEAKHHKYGQLGKHSAHSVLARTA
jgi:hypothetical protein